LIFVVVVCDVCINPHTTTTGTNTGTNTNTASKSS
jgi:hypothetical protein